MKRALRPFGSLFGALAAARVALYRRGWLRQTRLAGPVVSVGNLSVGGSGKTPLVARVARLLQEAELPVAILSRGYGGRFRGRALVVSDGERVLSSASEAGDEPLMLARELPGVVVAVGPHRDVVGARVEEVYGKRIHLLDDGFQHLRLARDLDLLCVDATQPEDLPLPAGRLREHAGAAARADLVMLTQADRASSERLVALEARHGVERTHRVGRRVLGFFDMRGQPCGVPQRPFILAGIARPERLEHDLRDQAGAVAGSLLARDHHVWRDDEIEAAQTRARAVQADAIVTTAKDAVRLPALATTSRPPFRVLRIEARIENESGFRSRLLSVAGKAA